MNSIKSYLVLFLCSFSVTALAGPPVVVVASPTSNIGSCVQAGNLYDASVSANHNVMRMKALLAAAMPGSADEKTLLSLIPQAEQDAEDLAKMVTRFNLIEMATAQIQLAEPITIPSARLGNDSSPAHIRVSPIQQSGDSIIIPEQAIVTLYGARICSELAKSNQSLVAAVTTIVTEIFSE